MVRPSSLERGVSLSDGKVGLPGGAVKPRTTSVLLSGEGKRAPRGERKEATHNFVRRSPKTCRTAPVPWPSPVRACAPLPSNDDTTCRRIWGSPSSSTPGRRARLCTRLASLLGSWQEMEGVEMLGPRGEIFRRLFTDDTPPPPNLLTPPSPGAGRSLDGSSRGWRNPDWPRGLCCSAPGLPCPAVPVSSEGKRELKMAAAQSPVRSPPLPSEEVVGGGKWGPLNWVSHSWVL